MKWYHTLQYIEKESIKKLNSIYPIYSIDIYHCIIIPPHIPQLVYLLSMVVYSYTMYILTLILYSKNIYIGPPPPCWGGLGPPAGFDITIWSTLKMVMAASVARRRAFSLVE